ncbi:TetR/AcrR family transcriptional regulator [Paenibacillus endoradicis]|uniref:TetR/AcrR family transcriptional regulator n=1 Tax=Paenibacillus endoradicis TaxID=2972487 RepID=UPI002158C076|nr:TetR/AcrR family transcriptional regulator [Paenibacillus endoradicis]
MMSNEVKVDLRVQRTKKLIRNAFVELLEEKELNKITINAITTKAEINRVTFYLHYKDINDLIDSMLNELIAELEKVLLDKLDRAYKTGDELSSLILLLEHIAENSRIYKVLLVTKNIPYFTPRLMDILSALIINNTEKKSIKDPEDFLKMNIPSDIAAWYGTSAMIGTISMWVGNDMPYTPKFLAEKIIELNPFKPEKNNK